MRKRKAWVEDAPVLAFSIESFGQLVDASIVSAPKQRTNKAEKQAIKEGRIPEDWQGKPAKLRQKDRDARWTVKTTKAKPRDGEPPKVDLAIPEFCNQNHISTDRRYRLIRRWLVTDAAHAGARPLACRASITSSSVLPLQPKERAARHGALVEPAVLVPQPTRLAQP